MSKQSVGKPKMGRGRLRSVGAVLAGLVAIFVLSVGTDQVLHVLKVYPPWREPMYDTGLLSLAFGYRFVFDVAGCYLTARLAPRAPMLHALTLGFIGSLLAIAGAVTMWDMGAHWYPIALVVTALPCAWLGGLLHARLHPAA